MNVESAAAGVCAQQQGLITWAQLRAGGVSRAAVSRAVRADVLHRVRRRVYALSPLPSVPRLVVTDRGVAAAYVAHARAVLLSLGPRACAGGRTAAALWGWAMLVEPARTIEVCVDHGRDAIALRGVRSRQRRGVPRVQRRPLADAESVWVTAAAQTVLDCALELPLLEAVVICDSALRAGDVTVDELEAESRNLRGVRDARRIRRVLQFADASSGSVLESVLRVRLLQAGLTEVQTQQVLSDAHGRRILRVDFCFREQRLVVEVDGQKWHPDPLLDRRLDNQLAVAGWRVVRYTWAEVVHDGAAVVAEIAAAVGRGTATVQVDLETAA